MAKEFSLIADSNPTVYKAYTIASQAYQVGDLVMLSPSAATVIPATSSSAPSRLIGVAMSAQVSGDTSLLVCLTTPYQLWAADVTNTANAAHNLQRMVLTDKGTVNNTGTDSTNAAAVFRQEGLQAGISTTRIVGRFIEQASV